MKSKNSKIIILAKGDISTKKKSMYLRQLRTDYIIYYRNMLNIRNHINMYVINDKSFRIAR